LAKASTALGLLTIGAGIEFATITSSKRNLTLICLLKLVIHPLIMLSFCFFFGIEGITRDVLLVYAALPVAASSYILARQFNAHGPLAASIVAITSLSCMLTLTTLLILL
jgi:hypothetical protein